MEQNQTHRRLSDRSSFLLPSKIREIAEKSIGQPDVIPLWFGEGAWPSSKRTVHAAVEALQNGDHFYQPNSGKPSLRDEITVYSKRIYDVELERSRITVTASGMQGLALVAQAIISPGDRVVALDPSWPNISQTFKISGAEIHSETLRTKDGRWFLDMDQLIQSLTPGTRAVLINSPNNPTGWTMSPGDQKTLLAHCRKLGIWIVSDDVYARLYLEGNVAPSFITITEPDDLFISVNSFSKAWSMTGWRLGWIVAPSFLESTLTMLTEFNIAGAPGAIQTAGEAALRHGEDDITLLRQRLSAGYDMSEKRLSTISRVEFIKPEGAFYCFFKVEGASDSQKLAYQILAETKIGLAPGIAFGPAGEGYLRLCYAQPLEILEKAFDRLESYLTA